MENGYDIPPEEEDDFDILCNFPPESISIDRWKRMCKIGNTPKWLNRSKAGRKNHKKDHSRHTGGSMGFDEHHIRLEKKLGKGVSYKYLFVDTHATKDCKKRLRDKEINIDDLDQLEFVTEKSKESYESFTKKLETVYGPNIDQNTNRNELVVWESLNPNSRFGIGSSDPGFVVTGTPTSLYGSTSFGDARRESQEVQDVRSQLNNEREARQILENRLSQIENEREEERERLAQMEIERKEEREERDKFKKQMDKIMRKMGDK